jgi:predicted acetyltransferase
LQHLELKRVLITLSVHNSASRQVAIKTGAQFLREEKDGLTLHEVKHDALIYAFTQPRLRLTA